MDKLDLILKKAHDGYLFEDKTHMTFDCINNPGDETERHNTSYWCYVCEKIDCLPWYGAKKEIEKLLKEEYDKGFQEGANSHE